MNRFSKLLLLMCWCAAHSLSYAQQATINTAGAGETCRPDCTCGVTFTPPGVITDHIHAKGEWMAAYEYMDTRMKGDRIGTTRASDDMIYAQNYIMAPEAMSMKMHMVMLMYGVTDRLSVMAMSGYAACNMTMNMDMAAMPGMTMKTGNMTMRSTSSGLTDTRVYGLYNLSKKESQRIITSMGITTPTGTINARGTTMLGEDQRMAYDMQPGTGSWNIMPGITYVYDKSTCSFGADAGADIKLSYNRLGYRQGNVYHASAWASHSLLSFVSGSLRAEEIVTGKISGSDNSLTISGYNLDPTADPANYGGKLVNLYAGLNFHFQQPALKKIQLQFEYGIPVYQDLNGTQMSSRSSLLAGVQYRF
jgi:hypothetical protein